MARTKQSIRKKKSPKPKARKPKAAPKPKASPKPKAPRKTKSKGQPKCACTTVKGKPCKNHAKTGSKYCASHQKCSA